MVDKKALEIREKIINLILNSEDFDYKSLFFESKEGNKIIEEIENFLKIKAEKPTTRELKKTVFENPLHVGDGNINNIVDAFVKMRDASAITSVNGGSLSGVLVMFNQWINLELDNPGGNPLPPVIIEAANEYLVSNAALEENILDSVPETIPTFQGDLYVTVPVTEGENIYDLEQQMQAIYNPDFSLTGPVVPYEERDRESVYQPRRRGMALYSSETRFTGPTGDEEEEN